MSMGTARTISPFNPTVVVEALVVGAVVVEAVEVVVADSCKVLHSKLRFMLRFAAEN